jgi:membrane-associated protease RseP (regulator of RpoE activity)
MHRLAALYLVAVLAAPLGAQEPPTASEPPVKLPAFTTKFSELKIPMVTRYDRTPNGSVLSGMFIGPIKAGSLAEKSGLKKGMEVVAIQYQLVAGLNQFEVARLFDQTVEDTLVLAVRKAPKAAAEEIRIPVGPKS